MSNIVHEPGQFKARITDWPIEERPREKLVRLGAASVSSAELIAILLGQGTPKLNVVALSQKLLRRFGSLEGLSEASLKELQELEGIGPAKAVTLLAAFQLHRNLKKEQAESRLVSFRNPAQVARIYQNVIGHVMQEYFYVVLLNARMERIMDFEVSKGSMERTIVHPREVFRPAVRNGAKGIILIHNHPGGVLEPSQDDLDITKRIIAGGEILGIQVYDHIIVTRNGYISLREKKYIKEKQWPIRKK